MRIWKTLIVCCLALSLLLSIGITTGFAEDKQEVAEVSSPSEEAERLYEIEELRESNSKAYQLNNGQIECEVYANDIHYLDQSGSYKDIDNSISMNTHKEGYKLSNTANSWHTYFSENLSSKNAVLLEENNYSIAFSLNNAKENIVQESQVLNKSDSIFDKTLAEDNRTVVYENVFSGVDIAYTALTNGLKEDIILRDKNSPNTFTFDLSISNLKPVDFEGFTYFVNNAGEKVFRLEPMFMEDSNGKYSNKVQYDILQNNGQYQIEISADENYLKAADTVYPVVIDPTVSVVHGSGDTYDSYVESRYPDRNNYLNVALRTGKDTYHYIRRTYIKFDLPSISGTVNSAHLKLKVVDFSGMNFIKAYRVTGSWSSSTITWNNKPGYTTTYSSYYASNLGNDWYSMDVKDIVSRWYNSTYTNYGFMVKDDYESDTDIWSTWHSSDASSHLDKPRLIITYGTPVAVSYGFDLKTLFNDPAQINTYPKAEEAYWLFDDLGYTRYIYGASSASTVRNAFEERAISYIDSHGNPGRIYIYDSSGNTTKITGDRVDSDSSAYSLENRYGDYENTMDPSRLIVYAACYTANDDATYGNLLERSAEYGADAVVGFSTTIWDYSLWTETFFTDLNNNHTVGNALWVAESAMYNQYGQYYGYNNYVIDGAFSIPFNVTVYDGQFGS